MTPLTKSLVDQLFSFMVPLGFTTYTMGVNEDAWIELAKENREAPGVKLTILTGRHTVSIQKEGLTIDFVYKKL